jgi:uncharacterized repeat protein (TIGR03803 family)
MTNLSAWEKSCIGFLLCAVTAIAAPAQTFTTLLSFNGSDGDGPSAPLSQGTDGNLYGNTDSGGANSNGVLFKFGEIHGLIPLYSFCGRPACTDGTEPLGGLLPTTDGYFYGTTNSGGADDNGTVFKINSGGELNIVHSFRLDDGSNPQAALIQATDGAFYGTTLLGGSNIQLCPPFQGCGTVFRMTADGTVKTVHSFDGGDGNEPDGALIQASDGNLYGTTSLGGTSPNCGSSLGCGTVFTINSHGVLKTLYNFCVQMNCTDGNLPVAGLVQATDGNFYGTTVQGGTDSTDCMGGCGTVFRITPAGSLSILHSFNLTDGAFPYGGLIQGTDGNLYGTAALGGDLSCLDNNPPGCGTIFSITLGGAFTTLHNLELTEGQYLQAGLFQATDGNFYGVAGAGGVYCNQYGCGTLFRLSMGLGPFVSFVRASGRVGQTGPILGQGLTGTTSVTLNAIPASFKVKSDTLIEATVPPGATTGYVTVTTPTGVLTSNVPFQVIP